MALEKIPPLFDIILAAFAENNFYYKRKFIAVDETARRSLYQIYPKLKEVFHTSIRRFHYNSSIALNRDPLKDKNKKLVNDLLALLLGGMTDKYQKLLSNYKQDPTGLKDTKLKSLIKEIREILTDLALFNPRTTDRKKIDLTNIDLSQCDLSMLDLCGFDFSKSIIENVDFSGATTTGWNTPPNVKIKGNILYDGALNVPSTNDPSGRTQYDMVAYIKSYDRIANVRFQNAQLGIPKTHDENHSQIFYDLRAAEFSDCIFVDCDIYLALLQGSLFENCHFTRTSFWNLKLNRAHFKNCKFEYCVFSLSDLRNIQLENCDFTAPVIVNCQMSDSVASAMTAKGYFSNIRDIFAPSRILELRNYNLYQLDLSDMKFENLDLRDVDFRYCQLSRCEFTHCNFERINFFNAKLNEASFKKCNIINSDFELAIFFNASLINSRIQYCNFNDASMQESLIKDCSVEYCNLNGATLDRSIFDSSDLTANTYVGTSLRETKINFDDIDLTSVSSLDDNIIVDLLLKKIKLADRLVMEFLEESSSLENLDLSGYKFEQKIKTTKLTQLNSVVLNRTLMRSLGIFARLGGPSKLLFSKCDLRKVFDMEGDKKTLSLSKAFLQFSNCQGVTVKNCKLFKANFRYSNFANADFRGITREIIEECNFAGCDFTGAKFDKNSLKLLVELTDITGAIFEDDITRRIVQIRLSLKKLPEITKEKFLTYQTNKNSIPQDSFINEFKQMPTVVPGALSFFANDSMGDTAGRENSQDDLDSWLNLLNSKPDNSFF